MIPVAARNAAFLAFAIELKHEEFVYTSEFARALDEALEAAAPHMPAAGAVSAVLALHREMECRDEDNEPVGGSYCEECKDLDDHSGERVHEVYPCMTVREITAALAGTETFTAMRDRIERTTK